MNFFLFLLLIYYGDCVIVNTKLGELKGETLLSRKGRPFYAFYGVPYAQPPIGELRYQNPIPPKPWKGLRDATVLPSQCLSYEDDGTVVGDEDCLYLNLYTPKLDRNSSLPVMVFIYGGRFMFGHALPQRYGAHYFMDKEVILITFHYRLGILGFLSTEDDVIPGNYGLKDAVAVLQWVQNHIESFGGDKNRVTVFGGSSGGATASLILCSPSTKGLFHQVISQSGLGIHINKPGIAKKGAQKIGSLLGCDLSSSQSLLMCLREKPAEKLIKRNFDLYTYSRLIPLIPWGPVLENANLPGTFLSNDPVQLIQKVDIPWIVGMNSADGAMFAIFAYFNPIFKIIYELEENYYKYFPKLFWYEHFTNDPEKLDELTDELKQHYFGDTKMIDNPQAFSKMHTYLMFLLGIEEIASSYNGPLYIYYYDHRNTETFAHVYGDFEEEMGVIHGDELISMFNWTEVITPVTEGVDLIVSEKVLDLWINFAATGNPNKKSELIWKPAEKSKLNYLHIKNGELKTQDHLLKEELDFLKNIRRRYS